MSKKRTVLDHRVCCFCGEPHIDTMLSMALTEEADVRITQKAHIRCLKSVQINPSKFGVYRNVFPRLYTLSYNQVVKHFGEKFLFEEEFTIINNNGVSSKCTIEELRGRYD